MCQTGLDENRASQTGHMRHVKEKASSPRIRSEDASDERALATTHVNDCLYIAEVKCRNHSIIFGSASARDAFRSYSRGIGMVLVVVEWSGTKDMLKTRLASAHTVQHLTK